jgi:DNA invertase Pin-like site-specific DNA recombinase
MIHTNESSERNSGVAWTQGRFGKVKSKGCRRSQKWQAGRQTKEGKTMKTVGLYARVSTLNRGQDTDLQLRELREYAEQRGWTILKEYVDNGVSGSKDSRPELNRLMLDAKQRKIDCVLVWKLDRFGRSLKHLVNALAELEAVGVTFVSLRDAFDLGTPAGRLMFGVVAAMAEFERDLIRERVKAGIRNAKAKGRRVGRRPSVIDHGRLATLRSQGRTIREIAKAMGVSRSLVHKTLQVSA